MVLKEEGGSDADNKRYSSWKTVVPFLYDQFLTHDLQWPSLSARLGPVVLNKHYRFVADRWGERKRGGWMDGWMMIVL